MDNSLRECAVRRRTSLDAGWKFALGDFPDASAAGYDDSGWSSVCVPHDWSIEGEYDEKNPTGKRGGFLPAGIGWYRRVLTWDPAWQSKKVLLTFDGIYMNGEVWLNGAYLGGRPNGYIGIQHDVTPYLQPGDNVIAVKADCSLAPSGRWYTGAGIYRHVWLTVAAEVRVPESGVAVTTPQVDAETATVAVETTIRNDSASGRTIRLISRIFDEHSGRECAWAASEQALPPLAAATCRQTMRFAGPSLWSPDQPAMYALRTEIAADGAVLDEVTTSFGVRYLQFDSVNGFTLNGKPLKLQGVCHHQDAGPAGVAVPEALLAKRLQLLKEMGCNAIRTAHHPMAPEFYELCDRIGLMVMDEAFDGWQEPKIEYDYSLHFERWWRQDLEDMVRRDRNHPCVILWSIGNEVKGMKPDMTRSMVDFVHRLDATRPVTCGVQQVGEGPDANRSVLDVAGYNDGGGACFVYEQDHAAHPERVMIATEAPHTFQTRGFYRTQTWWRDKNQPRLEIANLTAEEIFFDGALQYNSSYDNSGVRTSARDSWSFVKRFPYLSGEFRWTGFDYLGESFGWPARSANFGVIDMANFPKDHYYFYQSQFTSQPMIHLLPHWTHPGKEGVVIPVWVYTNCEEAELLLNGRSLGRKRMDERMYLSWDVPYEPGELQAVGYIGGVPAADKSAATAGEPAAIRLHADAGLPRPNGADVAQVSFAIVDKDGRVVPYAEDTVYVHAEGSVRFLGMENGDPLDLTTPRAPYRKAFYGLGMGLLQATREAGDIEVLAAGIVGRRVFTASALVSIAVSRLALRGELRPRHYEVFVTLDGSEPDRCSPRYETPFTLETSCTVRAAVFDGNRTVARMTAEFRQGEREPVRDLTHGNKPYAPENRFAGPFAEQLHGEWSGGASHYVFAPDGGLHAYLGAEAPRPVGCWWYDYPADPFETPNYAGTGEIRWEDGTTAKLALETQESRCLIVTKETKTMRLSRMNA